MEILREIISRLEKGKSIKDIRRGPLWTGVVSKGCGLASALNEGGCNGGGVSRDGSQFLGIHAEELAALSFSPQIPEASLGMAAINSLLDPGIGNCDEGNVADLILNAGRGKNVAIIGHFPFVNQIREVVRNLWVIEKRPRAGDIEAEGSKTYLPQSDVIAISSTTLLNHTLPDLLPLCPADSIKILLGPTTPMSPVLFDYGIDLVSGSIVTDIPLVLANIDRGVSFSEMKRSGGIKLVSLIKDRKRYQEIMARS